MEPSMQGTVGWKGLVGKYISAVFENLERGHSGERVERWKEIRSCGSRFSFILEKKQTQFYS